MRILQFLNSFGATTTTFIHSQLKVLAQEHEVLLICTSLKNEERFPFSPIEVISYHPNIWVTRIRRRLFWYNISMNHWDASFAGILNKVIGDFQPDVIHCQFGPDALKLIDNLVYRKKDIPIFIQFRGYDASKMLQSSPVYVRRLRTILKRKNIHPIFVAHFLYENLRERHILPDKKRILYSCTDLTKFKRNTFVKGPEKIFLQVSSFVEKKGHLYTIKAFSLFAKHNPGVNWKLILAGDGPLRGKCIQLIEQNSLSDHIFCPGEITHEEAKEWMEKAHYFVHHSITTLSGDTEGIPNAIMEAMAMELPVIASNHAGIPELIQHGTHGYLIEERDVETYAQRIKDILKWGYQPENRKRIKALFEINHHKKTLVEFYQEVLNTSD